MIRNVYWKFKRHLFVLLKIYPLQATFYFLVYYYFYLRSTVYMLSKMVWNYHQSLSKYCKLACLFRFAIRFRCHLNLTMSLGLFDLFELIWRRDLTIICSWRFLLKWGFWFSSKIFIFLEVFLSKIETRLFSKTTWVPIASMLLKTSNSNWPLSFCLKWRYIYFFGSKFVLKIAYMMVITQTNFKEICRHK